MTIKHKIRCKAEVLGIMIQDFTDPIIIPTLAELGYDFVVIDQEHGPSDYRTIQNLVIAALPYDMAVLLRPPKIEYEYIAKALDMGVEGLMIPHVDTAEQVRDIIQWVKYPPVGSRSYGMRRILSNIPGVNTSKEYIRRANEESVIFIQVESPTATKNIQQLLEPKEIDGVIMGPADYTMNIGCIGEYSHPEFVTAAETVLKECNKRGKAFGIHFGDLDLIKEWQQKGMRLLMYSNIKGLIKKCGADVVKVLKGNEYHPTGSRGGLY